MLKSILISVTEFQTKPDVPWCSLGAASLLKTSRWRLKEIQRHPAKATVQRGHRSRGESGWREYHAQVMAVELLMVSHGSYAPVTGKVSWGNKPRSGHLLPANVGDGKFQNARIISAGWLFFFGGLRTSLFYCPIACHSLIQPVGLRMREGEPGCVDLGLGCREHMEVDWIGMKWDSFPCRKTNSEMKVSWHGYPKSSSCGWPWLRSSHGDLGLPHDLRTPQRVAKDSWWPAGRSQANGISRKGPGGDLVILPRQSAEIDPFHSFKVTGQENTI